MAKEKHLTETAPEVQLFELSPEERQFFDNQQKARTEAERTKPDVEAEAQRQRKALFDALIAKYPPSIGSNGARVWQHAALGEAAYIEVAINGKFFDPRGVHADYRPDLDVPTFGQPAGAVFLQS